MALILVIDDDPDIREAVTLVLEKEGHQVFSAENRSAGEKAVRTKKPELIILDVMMEQPDDGIALAQQLRQEGHSQPILMLTSISRVTGMDYAKDDSMVPVDEYQEKPISPAELVKKVNQLLQKN